jgi:hypothetical protein
MTPKEKAIELVGYYYPFVYCYAGSDMITNTVSKEAIVLNAKQCVLIAVDEIIKELIEKDFANRFSYWQEVKQEIINL